MLKNITLIGESINDSVPSTKKMLDEENWTALEELAVNQDQKGAAYIDVNIGTRSKDWMERLVRTIQKVTARPLSIDSPDPEICRVGLQAYDPGRAQGAIPILNSISPLRAEMFNLLEVAPFMPILLISERIEEGRSVACHTAEQTFQAAQSMVTLARTFGLQNHQLILDPGIAPIGSDMDGNLKRLLDAMQMIQNDADLQGVHFSVGLSNFTVMLPSKRKDGLPVKSALESAFLTKAIPLGLDMFIGSVNRKYEILADDHPAMICLNECLDAEGTESLMIVSKFYRGGSQ